MIARSYCDTLLEGSKMKTDKITETIQYTLSQPPCESGRRLKSERELAKMFRVGESRIRSSLEQLVREGILFRRRGSGTFVRRVAKAPASLPERMLESAEQLLSPLDENGNTDITPPKIKLHIGLWTDYSINEPIQQSLLSAVSRAVSIFGHRLTVHSVLADFDTNQRKPISALREEIEEDTCDGYIVTNEVGGLFQEAIGEKNIPVVYYLSGIAPIEHEPFIFFNTTEAIERAVSKFSKAGYKKISLIGIDHSESRHEQAAYEHAMSRAGLSYRKAVFSREGVGQIIGVTRELVSGPDAPDAIYVSDDNVMVGVAEYLDMQNIVPGVDLGVISLSNRGYPLPPQYDWSRMEFDRDKLAQVIVNNLLGLLQTAKSRVNNHALHASWIPGETVIREAKDTMKNNVTKKSITEER